jgi:hypothetical protein
MDLECEVTRIDIIAVEISISSVWLSDCLQGSFIEYKLSRTGSGSGGEDRGTEFAGNIKKQVEFELHDDPTAAHTGKMKFGKLLNRTILGPVSSRK